MNYNSKFNFRFKTIHKLDSFGTNFVVKGNEDHKYKAKCLAYCPKETHLIILNMKNYKRIQDRIQKKDMLLELQFLREISQLK